jgi:hypothetical protein
MSPHLLVRADEQHLLRVNRRVGQLKIFEDRFCRTANSARPAGKKQLADVESHADEEPAP